MARNVIRDQIGILEREDQLDPYGAQESRWVGPGDELGPQLSDVVRPAAAGGVPAEIGSENLSSSSKGKNKGKVPVDRTNEQAYNEEWDNLRRRGSWSVAKGKDNVKGKNKGDKAGKGGKMRDAPGGKGKDRSVRPRNVF